MFDASSSVGTWQLMVVFCTTGVGGRLPTLIHMSTPSRIALAAFNRMEYCFVLGGIGRGTIFRYTLVVVNRTCPYGLNPYH